MPRPSQFTEGSAPRRTDTRQRLLAKWLGKVQDNTSGIAENDPKSRDTQWTLKQKLTRALNE